MAKVCFLLPLLLLITCLRGFGDEADVLRSKPSNYQAILDEISSLEVSIKHLTPDKTGSKLAYARSSAKGLGLVIVDLMTLKKKEFEITNEVAQIFNWSTDGRFLPILQKQQSPRHDYIACWDDEKRVFTRLSAIREGFESSFTWLSNDRYFFVSRPQQGKETTYFGDLRQGILEALPIHLREDKFVATTENSAAFAFGGNIYGFVLRSDTNEVSKIAPITQFPSNQFDSLQWLRYSRDSSQYLFCARPTNSDWRYLFRYDPAAGKATQLSSEDTYNGQFLEKGRSVAYVANVSNRFQLVVRPVDTRQHTNLFTEGSVVSFSATQDGNKVFAHAAVHDEPHGIWEYSLESRLLRQVVSGNSKPFLESRVISPTELRVKSSDGFEVPCFFFRPPSAEKASSSRKFPAVIYIPPNSAQMQRSYGPRSQLLANIGFFYLAVNYRGVDGYGKEGSNSYDPDLAAQDVLAAYKWLIGQSAVDKESIFIFSMSGGTPICEELLTLAPQIWRGIAIDKPSAVNARAGWRAEKFPPLLFISGERDPALPALKNFEEWVKQRGGCVDLQIYENAAHITYDLESRKKSQQQVADFYFRHMRGGSVEEPKAFPASK